MLEVENNNLILTNPTDLLKDNPAAFIINYESYDRLAANFSYDKNGSKGEYDLPQVVRVATYSATGEEAIRLFVRDGHTRTKYVADHMEDVILPKFPDFEFKVRDVTDSQLENPLTVFPGEKLQGQTALTMLQYLRSIIPPTVEHSQIAPDRIAAHLINGWGTIVGADIAEKFSAIAALSFLQDPNVHIATDNLLRRELSSQTAIIANETPEERAKVEKALIEMASIIRESKLGIGTRIAESAFMLVASGSKVIGGERTAMRQIHGLLHTPVVEQRLQELSLGEREEKRLQIAQLLTNAFKTSAQNPTNERLINNNLQQTIRDPRLSITQVEEILISESPMEKYNQVIKTMNIHKLQQSYLQSNRGLELAKNQLILIDNFGGKLYLDEREIEVLIGKIDEANATLDKANEYRKNLIEQRGSLKQSGVKDTIVADALIAIDQSTEAILSTTTLQTLPDRLKKLNQAIEISNNKISQEITLHVAGEIVDEIYEDILPQNPGVLVRARIINFIASEFGKINPGNENLARMKAKQLSELDHDLQARITISGDLRLEAALRIQEERDRSKNYRKPDHTIDTSPVINIPPVEISPNPVPPTQLDPEFQDQQSRNLERIRINRARLRGMINNFSLNFNDIDLDRDEVDAELSEDINSHFRVFGHFWFRNPDTVRVMTEDYPRSLEEKKRALEDKIQRDEEETHRDTRTSI